MTETGRSWPEDELREAAALLRRAAARVRAAGKSVIAQQLEELAQRHEATLAGRPLGAASGLPAQRDS